MVYRRLVKLLYHGIITNWKITMLIYWYLTIPLQHCVGFLGDASDACDTNQHTSSRHANYEKNYHNKVVKLFFQIINRVQWITSHNKKVKGLLTDSPFSLWMTRLSSMSHLFPRIIFSTSSFACWNQQYSLAITPDKIDQNQTFPILHHSFRARKKIYTKLLTEDHQYYNKGIYTRVLVYKYSH